MKRRRMTPLTRFRLVAYGFPLPATATTLWLLHSAGTPLHLALTAGMVVLLSWLAGAACLVSFYVRPLQTAANLLSAVREGDFSIRARRGPPGDPLGDLNTEINMLAAILRRHRLHAIEATALVTAVMEAIDVAVFAIDSEGLLRLANPAGQRLLAREPRLLLGRPASEFGLSVCLEGEPVRVLAQSPFPGHPGSWGLRRCGFREDGRPHTLLLLADLSQALRAEQTKAWQSLVRVLGHELNNSLAPIKSIAGSLGALVRRQPRPADMEEDLRSGLDVIAARAEGLSRFMQAYSSLARLPAPQRSRVSIGDLLREALALETRVAISLLPGPECRLDLDPGQLGQVLTNLLRNAAEAVLAVHREDPGPGARQPQGLEADRAPVLVSWQCAQGFLEVQVVDCGQGVANPANLFVPFFTTKAEGSGIGLALSRQIVENHGGTLGLANRTDAAGCCATLRLPLGGS